MQRLITRGFGTVNSLVTKGLDVITLVVEPKIGFNKKRIGSNGRKIRECEEYSYTVGAKLYTVNNKNVDYKEKNQTITIKKDSLIEISICQIQTLKKPQMPIFIIALIDKKLSFLNKEKSISANVSIERFEKVDTSITISNQPENKVKEIGISAKLLSQRIKRI